MSDRVLRPVDVESLKQKWTTAKPYPFFVIDEFLESDFVDRVIGEYPPFDRAKEIGRSFEKVNEQGKVQITDSSLFPPEVARLHAALSAPSFLAELSQITGIANLRADPKLHGGGMHITRKSGRLDVHADFNFLEDIKLFRRLNILVYLNAEWDPSWGGGLELWDPEVTRREFYCLPRKNRCLLFETTKTSFHGVEKVQCPEGKQRQSFAAYYYTEEPPPGWDGSYHSTIFKARPDEAVRGAVLMPAEKLLDRAKAGARRVGGRVKKLLGAKP